jgi:hypothetical protein
MYIINESKKDTVTIMDELLYELCLIRSVIVDLAESAVVGAIFK